MRKYDENQQIVFFAKIIKNQNLSNMHISDISTIELHNKHFLTWKMQEELSVQ